MVSLGCPKNLTESETVLGSLASAGYVITSSLEDAEIILVNTCGFIRAAVKESLETIAHYAHYKQSGTCRYLVVFGCLPQRYGHRLTKLAPEVDLWLGVNARAVLPDVLESLEAGAPAPSDACGTSFMKRGDKTGLDNTPRLLSTPPATAYLKIAEGCSHGCSYCLIPGLRGGLASRPMQDVCREAAELVDHGVREITLVAQDTGSYGRDLYGKPVLDLLIRRLSALPDLRWLRIMYLNPYLLTPELLTAIQEQEKVCRYLDLPFQHACARVLRLMNRPGNLEDNLKIVADLRRLLPGVVLRTTLMTGFPGEDDDAFGELENFTRQAKFDRLGVFAYCHEKGAASFRRRETVSFVEKQRRRRQLYDLQRQISGQANVAIVGRDLLVLIEKELHEPGLTSVYLGRSYRDAPDVDPKIIVRGEGLRVGDFATVRITHAYPFDLAGIALQAPNADLAPADNHSFVSPA
jgi:ribosomal protein S12 methylthiotransferase